jgi:ribosomal protein S18 acetylase RimI-like enzyme
MLDADLANNSYLSFDRWTGVLVRIATMEDMPYLLSIERDCFGRERFSRSLIRSLLVATDVDVIVGTWEGEVVASAMVLHDPLTLRSRILSLAILPLHQGRGYSKVLLTDMEDRSSRRGSVIVYLEVRVENEAAIHLYLRSGYRIGDRIPDFFGRGQDAWYMERDLKTR